MQPYERHPTPKSPEKSGYCLWENHVAEEFWFCEVKNVVYVYIKGQLNKKGNARVTTYKHIGNNYLMLQTEIKLPLQKFWLILLFKRREVRNMQTLESV